MACTPTDPKLKQYLVEGERLYVQHCSNCHQRDGQGLRRVYPPLAGSDFLPSNLPRVVCSMKYGLQGEITVNGVMYNQAMPGVLSLTELELAEIATYLYNSWGARGGLIDARQVGPMLDSCARPRSRR
jgi:mono/diheme cytochrome c family protein